MMVGLFVVSSRSRALGRQREPLETAENLLRSSHGRAWSSHRWCSLGRFVCVLCMCDATSRRQAWAIAHGESQRWAWVQKMDTHHGLAPRIERLVDPQTDLNDS